tara:strand:- start:1297 stop:1920 length:624 start_codon:yes stop_codon:yes gene_type:complete
MKIKIKKSIKPVNYDIAINYLEKRVLKLINNKSNNELIWFLEHPSIFTSGTRHKKNEILDKSIKIIKSSRGGKITWHGPGQLICYFVIDLNKRKKDIRNLINIIEKSIINSLNEYNINSENDRKNVGIWYRENNKLNKIAAIGIRVKRWIAYHGFSINIKNDLNSYKKIIPCGVLNRGVTNLANIKKQNYDNISDKLAKYLIKYLKS